tara:strand:+ start:2746 stop:2850 length:105 start_codon:yes stop_codon:yes gene_type:complete
VAVAVFVALASILVLDKENFSNNQQDFAVKPENS